MHPVIKVLIIIIGLMLGLGISTTSITFLLVILMEKIEEKTSKKDKDNPNC